uniref:Uncharacterized protein n=1 Tax=Oryza punctata TaxID=4537 RepID=A0A0E0L5H2_ORYPU
MKPCWPAALIAESSILRLADNSFLLAPVLFTAPSSHGQESIFSFITRKTKQGGERRQLDSAVKQKAHSIPFSTVLLSNPQHASEAVQMRGFLARGLGFYLVSDLDAFMVF